MALIVNIDTAVEIASICLAKDGEVLSIAKNVREDSFGESQKDHAAWLHVAIKEIFEKNNLELRSADAIAVTGGPGSYTGLRIGMATAKGICYALNKPLITLNTLLVMANAAKKVHKDSPKESFVTLGEIADLLCPMIDARRMEVFTAIYTRDLKLVKEPAAITLTENSFDEYLSNNNICFFGNGSNKFKAIKKHEKGFFSDIKTDALSMIILSEKSFAEKEFADLAYAEPLYLKEFYTPSKRSFTK
jgi:tRNA threonylcarbamoyladenosine biosynthesis protein TsaB